MSIVEQLGSCGLIPVIKLNDAEKAVPLSKALLAGGISCIEITFRTSAAKSAIESIAREIPEMLVGAGTVITHEQLRDAKNAGAKFIVSPGLDSGLVSSALDSGLAVLPGVVTPSELMAGLTLGLNVFKFFPAETFGGLKAIKALGAPFGGVRFVPTGGIDGSNASDYWKSDRVLAVGGSWIAPEKLIDGGDFEAITSLCKSAVELMRSARG